MRTLLTVDPGYITGLAFWKSPTYPIVSQINLNKLLMITLEKRLQYMWEQFDLYLTKRKPNNVIIEGVELWGSSLKSLTSGKRGDLFKLAYLVGGYCNLCDNHRIEYGIVNFKEWGGQLSPEAVKHWVRRVLGKTYPSQHQTDAVAIGLNYFGKFKKSNLR